MHWALNVYIQYLEWEDGMTHLVTYSTIDDTITVFF